MKGFGDSTNVIFLDLGAVYRVKILPNHTYDYNLLLYGFYTSTESPLKKKERKHVKRYFRR